MMPNLSIHFRIPNTTFYDLDRIAPNTKPPRHLPQKPREKDTNTHTSPWSNPGFWLTL